MGKKFYAVQFGREPGVYYDWESCKAQVDGFKGARYKSFSTEEEAQAYVNYDLAAIEESNAVPVEYKANHINIWVDGSYNKENNKVGYAVYLDDGTNQKIITDWFFCREGGRNAEGEVAAVIAALNYVQTCSDLYESATIYYDYKGIQAWAEDIPNETKRWAANTGYSKFYREYIDIIRKYCTINYIWTHGHTGIKGNEYVDKLAKFACNNKVTENEKKYLDSIRGVEGFPDGL